MELIKDPKGAIITLLTFKAIDGLNERLERCTKIKVNEAGQIAAVHFDYIGGAYWQTFIKDKNTVIIERPKLGNLLETEYYLKIIDLARADNQPQKVIKYLISLYDLAEKHQDQKKRLDAELLQY